MHLSFARASCLLLAVTGPLVAQDDRSPGQLLQPPTRETGVSLGEGGLVLRSPDSTYNLTVRFRVQNLVSATSEPDATSLREVDWSVRRARLWLGGTIGDPRLTLLFQLGLSRRDQDAETWGYPVLVRDAFATWRWNRHLRTGLGVAKLPGNRNRVLSSADMVFPERAIVNNTFNIDRDLGVQAFWYDTAGRAPVHLSLALTTGRGRAATPSRSAALTARVEVEPLGGFRPGNAYLEGAVLREPAPRLALGLTAQRAWDTDRAGVTVGPRLAGTADVTTLLADGLFKWDRATAYAEWAYRSAAGGITREPGGAPRFVTTGHGLMLQATWLAAPRVDLAMRAAWVWPAGEVRQLPGGGATRQFSLAVNRYLRGHRVKAQAEVTRLLGEATSPTPGATWLSRVNLEVGL
ncbi:MAG: porin [Gemmatimonadales bacterium]|nr:porin [Gemmatimonadales bacterium]